MAVALPRQPLWLQNKGYSARDDREILSIIGAGVYQGMAVTPGTGMNVSVAPGVAVVPGTRNVGQGGYGVRIDSSLTVPWPAAGGSSRVDTLYIQVLDNVEIATAGGTLVATEGAVLDVAQGTSTVPADALAIASVTVPGSATSILAGNIASVRAGIPLSNVSIDAAQVYAPGQGIPYNTLQNVAWTVSQFKLNDYEPLVGGIPTIGEAGWYDLSARAIWASAFAGGIARIIIRDAGGAVYSELERPPSPFDAWANLYTSATAYFAAGTQLYVTLLQTFTGGVSRNIQYALLNIVRLG